MRKLVFCLYLANVLIFGSRLHATIFGKVQGIVHDPQHRPVSGASAKLQAITSDWSQTAQTDDNGESSDCGCRRRRNRSYRHRCHHRPP